MGDSDSENEGSQTNVSRLVIRPPGHTGKAQKGHLAFEATFESANLGRVDFVSDTEYDIYIRPDTCNPRHRFWFFFSIENTQENQRIIFNVVNISKSRNLLMNGLTPVVKSTSRSVSSGGGCELCPAGECGGCEECLPLYDRYHSAFGCVATQHSLQWVYCHNLQKKLQTNFENFQPANHHIKDIVVI